MSEDANREYKKTYAAYADDYSVSTRTIKRWAKSRYPLDDPAAMREKLGLQKNVPASQQPIGLAAKKERLLEEQIKRLVIQNEITKSLYTENSKVREDMAGIATAMRAALMRLENDLPGVLAGLGEAAIQRIIREKCDEIMLMLSDSTSTLYPTPPVPCPPSP